MAQSMGWSGVMGENHEGATYVVDRHRRHVTISNAYIGSASSVYNEIQK